MLSVEIVSHTRLLFQYMNSLTKSEKLRAFIAPKMTDIINFFDKNGKSTVYCHACGALCCCSQFLKAKVARSD